MVDIHQDMIGALGQKGPFFLFLMDSTTACLSNVRNRAQNEEEGKQLGIDEKRQTSRRIITLGVLSVMFEDCSLTVASKLFTARLGFFRILHFRRLDEVGSFDFLGDGVESMVDCEMTELHSDVVATVGAIFG